ncbi:hypothetical protein, partial [Mesorhizobium sp.]|uniref:hypothetical protein n=1 Tax=Mesorhizobium sp. TaxID=1871066 RepID=UPI0025B810EB
MEEKARKLNFVDRITPDPVWAMALIGAPDVFQNSDEPPAEMILGVSSHVRLSIITFQKRASPVSSSISLVNVEEIIFLMRFQ